MTDYVRAVRTCLGAGASRAELEAVDDLHAAIEEMGDGDAAAGAAAALWSARETDPEDALVSGGIGT